MWEVLAKAIITFNKRGIYQEKHNYYNIFGKTARMGLAQYNFTTVLVRGLPLPLKDVNAQHAILAATLTNTFDKPITPICKIYDKDKKQFLSANYAYVQVAGNCAKQELKISENSPNAPIFYQLQLMLSTINMLPKNGKLSIENR